MLTVAGVDPGVVHTGVVKVVFYPEERLVTRKYLVVDGLDEAATRDWLLIAEKPDLVMVEEYVPWKKFGDDRRMVQAEREFASALPNSELMRNHGVKKLVPKEVLAVLGLDKFSVRTHHDDLTSAARIMVAGMLKRPEMNHVLADVVKAWLDLDPWTTEYVA